MKRLIKLAFTIFIAILSTTNSLGTQSINYSVYKHDSIQEFQNINYEKDFDSASNKKIKESSEILLLVKLSQFHIKHNKQTINLKVPTSNEVNFYLIDENNIILKEKYFKKMRPKSTHLEIGLTPSFTFSPQESLKHRLLIKVLKPKNLIIGLDINTYTNYKKYEHKIMMSNLFYAGGLTALAIFIFSFSIVLRKMSFFYYLCFVITVSMTMNNFRSVLYILTSSLSHTYLLSASAFTFLSISFALLCTNSFLYLKKYNKRIYTFNSYLSIFFASLAAINAFSAKFDFNFLPENVQTTSLVFICFYTICCASFLYKHEKLNSLSFVFSWGVLFSCVLLRAAGLSGLIPYHPRMDGLIHIGVIIQSSLLIYSLWGLNHDQIVNSTKASDSDKLRRLIRVICHDSINLLNVALSKSELFLEDKSSNIDMHLDAWKKVNLATKDQIELLGQVRDLEALKSGKIDIELSTVSVSDVLHKSVIVFESALHKKDLTINISIDDEISNILADKISLSNNVINNIISNSIKFSYPGSSINVNAYEQDDYVVISISDFGIGIPANILETLFDPSAPTSRIGTSKESGTGFGMPLVKSTMDQYDGDIKITSKSKEEFPKDHGTTFYLYLPKSTEKVMESKEEVVKENLNIDSNLRILVLDDDPSIREIISIWMAKLDLHALYAANDVEATEYLREFSFDICLIDQNLGNNKKGSELVESFRDIAIVESDFYIMSADSRINDNNFRELGFNGILQKPLTKKKLKKVLSTIRIKEAKKAA